MKKFAAAVIAVCMLLSLVPLLSTAAAGAQSTSPTAYKDLHKLSADNQQLAQYLIENAPDPAPKVPNDPVIAEYEDSGITMWFDHSCYNTPAEEITSNGRNTYQIRLAKNETEGCHLLIAADKDMEGLTLSVSSFKNADGKKLDKEICYGWYFDDVDGKTVADPIPVLEHEFDLTANKSQMFIIKVKSKDTSPAGQYAATVKLKDGEGKVIKQANVYAYVWDFTLPVASYCKTLTDLNEWAVIVGANRENTTTDGLEDDLYSLYYEYLLDNKVNCYTLPYAKRGQFWDDRVEQYMDDPRCTAFTLFWKLHPTAYVNGKYHEDYIQVAYDRVSKKQEWLDKAYFYPDKGDEPLSAAALNNIKTWNAQFTKVFGAHKLIIPIHYNTNLTATTDFFKYLENDVTVWCPKTYFFNDSADKRAYSSLYNTYYNESMENKYGTFADRMAAEQAGGDEVWWYVTRFPHDPEITFSINDESVKHRILFWQTKLYNVDGVLYYMCNDWENSKQWTKKYEHAVSGTIVDTYGNGVLIYPGGALQEYIDKYGSDGYPGPIGSLRLESIRDGVEDYDYFTLLDEKYGEGTSDLMIKQVTTALGDYSTDTELFAMIRTTVGNLLASDAIELPEISSDPVIKVSADQVKNKSGADLASVGGNDASGTVLGDLKESTDTITLWGWLAVDRKIKSFGYRYGDEIVLGSEKAQTGSEVIVAGASVAGGDGETSRFNISVPVKEGEDIEVYGVAELEDGTVIDVWRVVYSNTSAVLQGDINGDGKVNNKDVVSLFRYVSSGAADGDPRVYDVTGDGKINNKDVVALFRAVSSQG